MDEQISVMEVESVEGVFTLSKYPKTDYTYSRLSKDRVELAPGQVAVPNMSRRSLAHFRIHGPVTSVDEVDLVKSMATRRYKDFETSDDEGYITSARRREERSLITRTFITVITTITTAITTVYHTITGHRQRQSYAYAARNNGPSILSRMVSYLMVPFHWIYSVVKNTTTTTITKITHNNVHRGASVGKHYSRDAAERRRWWPWLLFVLLLPILGYGSYYTYENMHRLATVNFSDVYIDLKEWSIPTELPAITLPALPNITMPTVPLPSFQNITLPDIEIPKIVKSYGQYKDAVQDRMLDASDYLKVVASSCYEELRRYWLGFVG